MLQSPDEHIKNDCGIGQSTLQNSVLCTRFEVTFSEPLWTLSNTKGTADVFQPCYGDRRCHQTGAPPRSFQAIPFAPFLWKATRHVLGFKLALWVLTEVGVNFWVEQSIWTKAFNTVATYPIECIQYYLHQDLAVTSWPPSIILCSACASFLYACLCGVWVMTSLTDFSPHRLYGGINTSDHVQRFHSTDPSSRLNLTTNWKTPAMLLPLLVVPVLFLNLNKILRSYNRPFLAMWALLTLSLTLEGGSSTHLARICFTLLC